jgi:hypothetical protein
MQIGTLATVFAYMAALQPWKGHKPVLDSKAI